MMDSPVDSEFLRTVLISPLSAMLERSDGRATETGGSRPVVSSGDELSCYCRFVGGKRKKRRQSGPSGGGPAGSGTNYAAVVVE